MRKKEKGMHRRNRVILIRVNDDERKAVEDGAKAEGKNLSEFVMDLLEEHKTNSMFKTLTAITKRSEKVLRKYGKLLKEYQQK